MHLPRIKRLSVSFEQSSRLPVALPCFVAAICGLLFIGSAQKVFSANAPEDWEKTTSNWIGLIWINSNDARFDTGTAGTALTAGRIAGTLQQGNDQSTQITVGSALTATISAALKNNATGASSLVKAGSGAITLGDSSGSADATLITSSLATTKVVAVVFWDTHVPLSSNLYPSFWHAFI